MPDQPPQEYHLYDPERQEVRVVVNHPPKRRYWLHALLLLATLFTTLCMGAAMQDSFNQTGGIDTRLVFFRDWFVDAHAAGTQSPQNPSGGPGSSNDVGASLSYRSNWLDGT